MASPTDDVQTQVNAIREMVKQQGAPPTAENWNRASLAIAQNGGMGPMLFDQAMERASAAPTPRQARQAATQAPAPVRTGAGTDNVAPEVAEQVGNVRSGAMGTQIDPAVGTASADSVVTGPAPTPAAVAAPAPAPTTGNASVDDAQWAAMAGMGLPAPVSTGTRPTPAPAAPATTVASPAPVPADGSGLDQYGHPIGDYSAGVNGSGYAVPAALAGAGAAAGTGAIARVLGSRSPSGRAAAGEIGQAAARTFGRNADAAPAPAFGKRTDVATPAPSAVPEARASFAPPAAESSSALQRTIELLRQGAALEQAKATAAKTAQGDATRDRVRQVFRNAPAQ